MKAVNYLLSFLLIAVLSSCSSRSTDEIAVKDWIVVPVFYATNRVYSGTDGAIAYNDEPNNKELLFGVKNIVVPMPNVLSASRSEMAKLGWRHVHTQTSGVEPVTDARMSAIPDKQIAGSQIAREFQAYANASNASDSVLFVHGCCANFETSMRRAAKVSAHMGRPVLLYDWVSPVGFRNYLQNETRVKQTTDDFCRFLEKVENVSSPSNITLLGHSMGAQFVDEAMVRRADRAQLRSLSPFKEVIMSNADVDAFSFIKHGREFVSNASKVHIYISSKDGPLKASRFAHGNFQRLGSPGKLLPDLLGLKDTTVVDISEAGTSHEIPFAIVSAIHAGNAAALKDQFMLEELKPGYIYLKRNGSSAASTASREWQSQSSSCVACD